jgi:anti-sigma factor ChrR (cupin superfamily)
VLFSNANDDPPGADLAFLRYLPNAFVPNHIHVGWEFAYVLSGDYYENDVLLPVGTLVLSSPGSEHFMRSEHGCMLLAMRAHPVAQNHDSTTRLRYGLPPGQLDYLKNGKAKVFER